MLLDAVGLLDRAAQEDKGVFQNCTYLRNSDRLLKTISCFLYGIVCKHVLLNDSKQPPIKFYDASVGDNRCVELG